MLIALVALAQAVVGATPYDVVVPNAIVRQHNQYVRCQDRNFDIRRIRDRPSYAAEVERAIAACVEEKADLMRQAEAILAGSPEYADEAVRQRALHEAFDGFDRSRRLMVNLRAR